jgi:hypothetical protein
MCPHCGRDAPIVYRGVAAYCTACGGVRLPLSGRSLNLAGRPSKVGGIVASVAGTLVLGFGLICALLIGGLLSLLGAPAAALWIVCSPIGLAALVIGVLLLRSGSRLRRTGSNVERATLEHALLSLVQQRGAVSAAEGARALGLGLTAADEVLTALAKREPELVAVEIDDQGTVYYRAAAALGTPPRRVRVDGGPTGATFGDARATGEEEDAADGEAVQRRSRP